MSLIKDTNGKEFPSVPFLPIGDGVRLRSSDGKIVTVESPDGSVWKLEHLEERTYTFEEMLEESGVR